ncbi:MAG: hypothetical protein Q9167_004870 [Letrouitia subvulpina]
MDSLWKSFATPVKAGRLGSDRASTNRLTSTLQQLLIILASSQLPNLSTDDRIHPTTGAYLGRGATYTVERRDATGKKTVAVKHIRQDDDRGSPNTSDSDTLRHRLQSVLLEVQVLVHPFLRRQRNIIRLLAHGWDEEILPFLVVELADLGTASKFLQDGKRSWNEMGQLVFDVASGLAVLHNCHIVHGDIKIENILIFSEANGGFVAKLSDFGFCGVEILSEYQYLGTRLLNAPEVRHPESLHTVYTSLAFMQCDVYSFGILAWETFNNGHRFYTSNTIGIASEEHEQAERFLCLTEEAGSSLSSYAEGFFRYLDTSPCMKAAMTEVTTMALMWDPSSRPQMVEIRDTIERMIKTNLDPGALVAQEEDYELLGVDRRSMSDRDVPDSEKNLGLDPPLRQLVEGFLEGVNDTQNSFAGQDCFHIAACYASGYGFEINENDALTYLLRAAKLRYKPAEVLKRCFEANGLLQRYGLDSQVDTYEPSLESFVTGAASVSPTKLPSHLVREYYTQQQNVDQIIGYYLEDQWFDLTEPKSLIDLLLNAGLEKIGKFYVELDHVGEIRAVPAIHFLISHQPEIARSVIAGDFNGLSTDDSQVSILNTACALGSAALAKDILRLFPDLAFIPSKDGTTPLHWLFMFEDKDMIEIGELLVACGARLSATAVRDLPDFNLVLSGPPLHWAIMIRNELAVRTLLNLGASMANNAPVPTHYKMYPWHALSLATCLFLPEMVQILLDAGAPLDGEGAKEGVTALHAIADTCDPFRLWFYHGPNVEKAAKDTIGVLLETGADINIFAPSTPLGWSTSTTTCMTWATKALLAYNPSIRVNDKDDGNSIITIAATSLRHDQINREKMRLILDFASSRLPQDSFLSQCIKGLKECAKYGMNGAIQELFAHVLPLSPNVIDEQELLHLAAEDDQVEMVKLLLSLGASIDLGDYGTAAACAALNCSQKSLCLLLESGSTVLSIPTDGSTMTLLHEIMHGYAPFQKTFKTLSLLHEHFRDRFLPVVNNFDKRGFTALHSAIICGKLANIALLLEKFGADPMIPIRGTSISLTTLAMLGRSHPYAYVRAFGDESLKQYDKDMAAIIEYLTGTWRLPAPEYSIKEHWVTTLWERQNSLPEDEDDFDWGFPEYETDSDLDSV